MTMMSITPRSLLLPVARLLLYMEIALLAMAALRTAVTDAMVMPRPLTVR